MAGKVVKFVVKSAVAGSLVYVTLRLTHGPWRVPPNVPRFADEKRFMYQQTPFQNNQMNPEGQDSLKETWNKGVQTIFNGLHEAPEKIKELSLTTLSQIKDKYKNSSKQ